MKKYPKSQYDQSKVNQGEAAYVTWSGTLGEDKPAFAAFNEEIGAPVNRTVGRWNQDLSNLQSNTSGKPGLSRQDYYAFRPGEAPATSDKGMMADANLAYRNVGLIRNVIDLMADFACQGIRLVHPNKKIEKFYQNWFKRVQGKDRSERFLNHLYRTGTVVIRKQTAKIKVKGKNSIHKAVAKPDTEITTPVVYKNEIPWRYNFLNPVFVDVVGGPLASFTNTPAYGIKLPLSIAKLIKSPKTEAEKKLVSELPPEVIAAAKTNRIVPLEQEKTSVFSYKKDDWQSWATPMIHAIMDDVMMLEKLRLADAAALDGAISKIRIFKLGNLEAKLMPTRVASSRLAEILESSTGGGTIDIIWGPDIELIESDTDVHKFLGEEKYKPHLNSIYAGLGIPPTLTGTFGAAGTTNNLISLKTLMGRLEYGRGVLSCFWEQEIVAVQKAMGFRFPAKIEFRMPSLGDDASEKAMLIQLSDRNLMSDEMVQHLCDADPELERIRINRENRERAAGSYVPKAGPYHDPQFGSALKKIALQSGVLTPSEVGLRKDAKTRDLMTYPAEDGQKPALLMKQPVGPGGGTTPTKKTGQPQQGRPKNSNDKVKRKEKKFVPKTKAAIELWAHQAQVVIAELVNPGLLQHFDKKNMRSLTQDESLKAENTKFAALCHLEPFSELDKQTIAEACAKGGIPQNLYSTYCIWVEGIGEELDKNLTLDELKFVQASIYAEYKETEDVEDSM